MAPRKRRAQRVASTTSKLGRRVGVALASLGLALGSLGTTGDAPASAAAAPAVTETSSGIWGGGFVNSLTKLSGTGTSTAFAAAGDVWGVARTSDAGLNWTTQNDGMGSGTASAVTAGLVSVDQKSIAAIIKVGTKNDLWAAFGEGDPANSGLMVSAGGTGAWVVKDIKVGGNRLRFQANGPGGGVDYPSGWKHPRPTGGILLEDGTRLLAGTFAVAGRSDNQGLVMGSATTTTWTSVALGSNSPQCGDSGCTVTAILKDPSSTGSYYVGTHARGLFRVSIPSTCSSASCTTVTPVTLAGTTPSTYSDIPDLAAGDGRVYVAAGRDGVFSAQAGATTFSQLAGFPLSTGTNATAEDIDDTYVTAVDVAGTGTGRKVYAGAANAVCTGTGTSKICRTVMRINDGVTNPQWTDVVSGFTPSITVAGTTTSWWLNYANRINAGNYVVSSIKVVAGQVFVAGRSGVWRNPTATNDQAWEPAVKGLPGTIHFAIASQASSAAFSTAGPDWRTFSGSGAGSAVYDSTFPTPSGEDDQTVGFSVAVDQSATGALAGQRIVGIGNDNDNVAGAIATSADGTAYTLVGPVRSRRVIGLGIAYQGTTRHIYAGLAGPDSGSGSGFYRSSDGGSTWVQATAPGLLTDPGDDVIVADIEVPVVTGGTVYVYDRSTGNLWRSADYGTTWAIVYTVASPSKKWGWIATDPSSAGRVWLSTPAGVTRLTTCLTGTCTATAFATGTTTGLPKGSLAGPIAINPGTGTVFVSSVATYGNDLTGTKYATVSSGLYKFNGTGWTNVSPATYKQVAGYARGLTITSSGKAYLATNGQGVRYLTGLS